MARFHGSWLACGLFLLATLGCGGTPTPPVSTAPDPSGLTEAAKPAEVVAKFLKSLQEGNEQVASALLTRKAREETERNGLVVQPPGSPESQYTVGQEQVEGQRSVVQSIWAEPDGTGQMQNYQVDWQLNLEQGVGWRISGMATPLDGQMVLLNFEEPLDMLKKWEAEGAKTEVAGQGQPASR